MNDFDKRVIEHRLSQLEERTKSATISWAITAMLLGACVGAIILLAGAHF